MLWGVDGLLYKALMQSCEQCSRPYAILNSVTDDAQARPTLIDIAGRNFFQAIQMPQWINPFKTRATI